MILEALTLLAGWAAAAGAAPAPDSGTEHVAIVSPSYARTAISSDHPEWHSGRTQTGRALDSDADELALQVNSLTPDSTKKSASAPSGFQAAQDRYTGVVYKAPPDASFPPYEELPPQGDFNSAGAVFDAPPSLYEPPPEHHGYAYGPPPPTYGPPPPSYGPPKDAYGPPKDAYGPPADAYGPPKDAYGPPPPSYGPYPPPLPPPLPEPEDDLDKGVYTHYNIGRKLYYVPLWFGLYFAGYVVVQLCKHLWRHRYTFPLRVEDALTATGRAADGNRDEILNTMTNAIHKASEKFKTS